MSDEIQLALQVFVSQSCDGLVEMEEAALALEAEPGNSDCVNTIFRICHTIKGDAVTVGFGGIAAFAHELENLLNGARSGEVQVDSGLVTLLLQCADVLRNLIQEAVENGDERRSASGTQSDQTKRVGRLEKAKKSRAEPRSGLPKMFRLAVTNTAVPYVSALRHSIASLTSLASSRLDGAKSSSFSAPQK